MPDLNPGRVAIVGLGSRGLMFLRGIAARPGADVVAICDVNKVRAEFYNETLVELSQPRASYYKTNDFLKMLTDKKINTLVVTTVDAFHDVYIVQALHAGVRVVTEKPMTTSIEKCRRINAVCQQLGKSISVAFNYRFNPVHELVKRTLQNGGIGKVLSVHFELLDTVHGADYFKRWHANKESSGGLMVHKSGHHFDLVNWWLEASPTHVAGFGQLGFYGAAGGGKANGFARDYERARGSASARDDPFATHLEKDETMRRLYAEAEGEDGYHRDRNCFQPGISIEDDVSLIVRFDSGATMSYHLTAYSPWEGYRVMFNGTLGRLELSVVESTHRNPHSTMSTTSAIHGSSSAPHPGPVSVKIQRLWEEARELPIEASHEDHGGGDTRMLNVLFGPAPGENPETGFASRQGATQEDGTRALAVGLAANRSFETRKVVSIEELELK